MAQKTTEQPQETEEATAGQIYLLKLRDAIAEANRVGERASVSSHTEVVDEDPRWRGAKIAEEKRPL